MGNSGTTEGNVTGRLSMLHKWSCVLKGLWVRLVYTALFSESELSRQRTTFADLEGTNRFQMDVHLYEALSRLSFI